MAEQPESIPVKEFVRLIKQAEKAVRENDLRTFEAVNAQIEKIGYRVIVRDGKTLIQQMYYNPATGGYEYPPPKP